MHNTHSREREPVSRKLPIPHEEKLVYGVYNQPCLVFGCGNTLFGDDGFGPEVIAHLKANYHLPRGVLAEDVGTSIRDLLFDFLLSPRKPRKIIVVDACFQSGLRPGELCELEADEMEAEKVNDFSVHAFPSLNLLSELDSLGQVEIRILAVKAAEIPQEVRPGLSPQVEAAVPQACEWIIKQVRGAL